MRTGILGGTFDPPHLGHLVIAAAAYRALKLDRVYVLPAGNPWRKWDRGVAPGAERLELVRAAFAPLAWAEVRTDELDRGGPTHSDETVEQLAAREPGDWWFILGADALLDMPNWHDPRRLVSRARIAVAVRPPAKVAISEALRDRVPGIEERIDLVEMPPLAISSTEIRRRVAAGESTAVWVPEAVRALIDEWGLYREAGLPE